MKPGAESMRPPITDLAVASNHHVFTRMLRPIAAVGIMLTAANCSNPQTEPSPQITFVTRDPIDNPERGWWTDEYVDFSETSPAPERPPAENVDTIEESNRTLENIQEVVFVYVQTGNLTSDPNPSGAKEATDFLSRHTDNRFAPKFTEHEPISVDVDADRIEQNKALTDKDPGYSEHRDYIASVQKSITQKIFGEDQVPDNTFLVVQWSSETPLVDADGLASENIAYVLKNPYKDVYVKIITHEFGHLLGLDHTPLITTESAADGGRHLQGPLTSENVDYSDINVVYGDTSHIMGIGDPAQDIFNGRDMARLGLITAGEITTIYPESQPASGPIKLDALTSDGPNDKLIEAVVPVNATVNGRYIARQYVYVELSGSGSEPDPSTGDTRATEYAARVYISDYRYNEYPENVLPAYAVNLTDESRLMFGSSSIYDAINFGAAEDTEGGPMLTYDVGPGELVIDLDDINNDTESATFELTYVPVA